MNDLIKQIVDKTGISADKAQQVLGVVSNFVKQKFPQLGGQIDSMLGGGGAQPGASQGDSAFGDLGSKLGV